MTAFEAIQKAVLSKQEAAEYLSLPGSKSIDNLVSTGRLCPLKITKEHVFARAELDEFVTRELARERRLRAEPDLESAGA